MGKNNWKQWRRMTKTRWIKRKTNEGILKEVGEQKRLTESSERETKIYRYKLQHIKYLQKMFRGKIFGRKA